MAKERFTTPALVLSTVLLSGGHSARPGVVRKGSTSGGFPSALVFRDDISRTYQFGKMRCKPISKKQPTTTGRGMRFGRVVLFLANERSVLHA